MVGSLEIGAIEDIRRVAPALTPEQAGDVAFLERRLADHQGALLTNGTGTGKTFSGLGFVARKLAAGAKNIIVVVPSDKVAGDWVSTARTFFGIADARQLEDTKDNGGTARLVVTTYANFGQNPSLVARGWDAVVADEAHYLSQDKSGNITRALQTLRALTAHPDGAYRYVSMKHPELVAELEEVRSKDQRKLGIQEIARRNEIANMLVQQSHERRAEVAKIPKADRPKVLLLSATPFAYHFSLDYGQGYLYDLPEVRDHGAYNAPNPRSQFYITHLGYRMRNGKLTQPENTVGVGILERRLAEHLMKQGAMAGRTLDVDQDYSREFVLTETQVGQRIDEILDVLWEPQFSPLSDFIGIGNYLDRRYLFEAIKARESIDRIRKHLALGRKVLVFHDYKKGGTGSILPAEVEGDQATINPVTMRYERIDLAGMFAEFVSRIPHYHETRREIQGLLSPILQFQEAFGDNLAIFNGDVPAKERRRLVDQFNRADSGVDVMLAQRASAKEGISMHDVRGERQRVLVDLGFPSRPTDAIQCEGRIYRLGVKSPAIFEYLTTGTNAERWTFAQTIANRASTAENLAMGERARALLQAFADGYNDASTADPRPGQGHGGKERDSARLNANPYKDAIALYYTNAKRSASTKSAEGVDYYATPEPLGFMMTEWGDVRPGEKILEPSAGHGAIARWFPDATNRHAIEPSTELAGRLALNATDLIVHRQDFESFSIVNKFDVIVMNPPFGHGGSTAIKHVAKAAQHLRDGGRIVALIPDGGMMDRRFDQFMDSEEAKGLYLTAEFGIPAGAFARAGTAVKTRVVILDKSSDPASAPISKSRYDFTDGQKIEDFFAEIEGVPVPPRPEKMVQEEDNTQEETGEASAAQAGATASEETASPSIEPGSFAAAEGWHAKKDQPTYVAKINVRLSREEYSAALARAKAYGGYYSAFKGQGAIPGFQFPSAEQRDQFLAEMQPNSTGPILAARPRDSGRDLRDEGRGHSDGTVLAPDGTFTESPSILHAARPTLPGETLLDRVFNRVTEAAAATDTVTKLKTAVADGYGAPFARPIRKAVDFLLKQAVPLQRLDMETNAAMREMAVKQAFALEEGIDVVRSLSRKPKFSDLGWPPKYANDKALRKRLFQAMQGKVPMASLPAEIQAIGADLRRRLNEAALDAVRQGRMHPDTFLSQRDSYMPHYYYDHEQAAAGSIYARLRLGLGDLMAQRTTMWRIEDSDTLDPYTGQKGALVAWDDKRVRFRDKAHRDAFYQDFILERVAEAIKTRGKVAAFSSETKSQIDRLTPPDLRRPDKLTDELRGYAKRVEQEMRLRYRKGDPLTDEEQERAGLIMDPVYAVAKHVASMKHDNAIAEFFNGLANRPDIIGGANAAGYTQLPGSRKLGRLAGQWVREDVAEEVRQLVEAPSALARLYDGILAMWKTGKTVYNPGTHVRNVLGNLLFAQFAGINPLDPRNLKYFKRAWTTIRAGGPLLEEMYREGVLGADYLTAELREDLAEFMPSANVEAPDWWMKLGMSMEQIARRSGMKRAKQFIEASYRMEDELFKAAAYLRATEDMPPVEAAAHVRRWFPYYDHIGTSSAIRALRRTAMPFFSFKREAVRILANAARERPVSLAFALAAPPILTALSAAVLGLDDEDYDNIRKTAMRGKGKFFARDYPLFSILLPMRSAEGRLQQFDLTNVMPFADLLGSRMESRGKMPAWQQMALEIITASPLTGLPLEMATNLDTFRGEPIWEENMTPSEQRSAVAGHVWREMVPPLAPGGTGWNTVARAGERHSNRSLETRNAAQAYLRALAGIDVRNASPNLYDMAEKFRAENGLPAPDYSPRSTPESRARARIWAQLVQDNPNPRAIANELRFLRSKGKPIQTEQDLNRLLFYRNPVMVIDGEANQRRWRRSLSAEASAVLKEAEDEFARIRRTSGAVLRQARALAATLPTLTQ